MKSADLQVIFQRVRGRCERIYARVRHFPSELAKSRSFLANSFARQTPLQVGKVLALFLAEPKCGWYRGNFSFSVPNPYGFGTCFL